MAISAVHTRDEGLTRLEVDWMQTIMNFVGFGLDLDCQLV